jgi:hypothetical protein
MKKAMTINQITRLPNRPRQRGGGNAEHRHRSHGQRFGDNPDDGGYEDSQKVPAFFLDACRGRNEPDA